VVAPIRQYGLAWQYMAWHGNTWHGTDDYLYAFQTDDGQNGVLQITGFTANPAGVKIRYKMVQSSNQQKP
jgi:hypothetical protein